LYSSEKEPQDSWGQFYKQWWGPFSGGKAALVEALAPSEGASTSAAAQLSGKRVIHVGDKKIWDGLCLLSDSQGSMLVRDEYAAIYYRLCELAASRKPGPVEPGAIVTGQPGIGDPYPGHLCGC